MIETAAGLVYDAKIMNYPPTHTVLVISSPPACPVMPGGLSAAVAGALLRSGKKVYQYDANLDLFLFHIFCGKDSDSFSILSSDRFYQAGGFLEAKNHVNKQLLLFSNAFFPHRMRWNSFLSPSDADPNRMADNPFAALCCQGLIKKIQAVQPETVLFCVSSADQAFAVRTMAAFIRTQHAEIQQLAVAAVQAAAESSSFPVDHLAVPGSAADLAAFLSRHCGIRTGSGRADPDFSGIPLDRYLSVQPVLPIDAQFFDTPDKLHQSLVQLIDAIDPAGFAVQNPGPLLGSDMKSVRQFFVSSDLVKKGGQELWTPKASLASMADHGDLLIEWAGEKISVSALSSTLWALSKQGAWHHIDLPADTSADRKKKWIKFITANPNIVHSYHVPDPAVPYNQKDINRIDSSFQAYSKVQPVPGSPFWQHLEHPAHIMLYLNRLGKHKLFCLRADAAEKSSFSIGEQISFHFKKPDALSPEMLDEICRMIDAGGSVDLAYVRYNLERAFLIGYAQENGVIVGNSCLKHPRRAFIQRINRITGLDFTHFVERGYTSVRPEYRAMGVGAELLGGLTKRAGSRKIFSIISEDNTATQKIALKNKTRKIAVYHSDKLGKKAGIWMPGHMIEDGWEILK